MFSIMWMISADGVAEVLAAEVGIDFGGGKVFVAKHLLNGTKVGTVLHQFSGKAVT